MRNQDCGLAAEWLQRHKGVLYQPSNQTRRVKYMNNISHRITVQGSQESPCFWDSPKLAEMRHNVSYSALVEDEAVLHEYHEVEELEDLWGGLVNSAQYCGVRLGYMLRTKEESKASVSSCHIWLSIKRWEEVRQCNPHPQQLDHVVCIEGVEARGRLVQEKQGGVCDQLDTYAGPLALATRYAWEVGIFGRYWMNIRLVICLLCDVKRTVLFCAVLWI